MAIVMPGTVIRFGAEYRRRPILSLFGSKDRGNGIVPVPDTRIRVLASIAITREFPDTKELLVLEDEPEKPGAPEDLRGRIVDIIT